MERPVLDHGYVKFIEAWGHGETNQMVNAPYTARVDMEPGIIEAARMSTQANFRSWDAYEICTKCETWREVDENGVHLKGFETHFQRGESTCEHQWKLFSNGDKGLLSFLYNSKPQHAGPFEFAGLIIEVQAPIFVFREWHRHRSQSYNEMSARYAPLPDVNYIPSVDRLMIGAGDHLQKNRQAKALDGVPVMTRESAEIFQRQLKVQYEQAEQLYQRALLSGVPKELARCIIPVGRYSRMRASANLRNWLAFMTLRYDPGAQWEIQQFAGVLGELIEAVFPNVWKLYTAQRGLALKEQVK